MLKTPRLEISQEMHEIFKILGDGDLASLGEGIIVGTKNLHNYLGEGWESHSVDVRALGLNCCYGVCDTPQQFLKKYHKALQGSPNTYVVGFGHMAKDPGSRGVGGGWRWHKWGPYVGEGDPQCEYLDDEDEFNDGVYCFHIHEYKPVAP